jgi:stage IV sporulation protein FB
MDKLRISFHPLFIVFAFIIVFFGWAAKFLIYVLVLLIHESAHYFVAKCYGYKLNKMIFMPYGAGISGENNIFMPAHEVVIAISGPLINILLVLICVSLWWFYPVTYFYTETFMWANFALGIFNFLPIFPLDGGRIVTALLSNKFKKIKILKFMRIMGFIFSLIFAILFFISVFYGINLTFIFISVFLFFSSFNSVKDVYYERSFIKVFENKDNLKPVEVKTYAVNVNTPIYKLVKYIKGNNFTQFIVLNEKNKIVKTLNEQELLKLLDVNKKTN